MTADPKPVPTVDCAKCNKMARASANDILENVLERDRIDSERAVAPSSDDAVVVDNVN